MPRAGSLLRYSATRLGLAPVMLWLIATLVFLLLRVAPGDPVDPSAMPSHSLHGGYSNIKCQ